jgi:hypothetical protein
MTYFRVSLARLAWVLAVASASAGAAAGASAEDVNKGDLGISLETFSTNMEGKGDCACGAGLYGVEASRHGQADGAAGPVIITPTAAPPPGPAADAKADTSAQVAQRFACAVKDQEYWVYNHEVCDVLRASNQGPSDKFRRKKVRRVAQRESSLGIRRHAGRARACVFGAPNASGCRNN